MHLEGGVVEYFFFSPFKIDDVETCKCEELANLISGYVTVVWCMTALSFIDDFGVWHFRLFS